MSTGRTLEVILELTTDADLLSVARGTAGMLAGQLGFSESQQLAVQEGVQKACQRFFRGKKSEGHSVQLQFAGFPDRIEIVIENDAAGEASEEDSYLLMQLMDRVVVEDTETGKQRTTLVKYLSLDRGAP